MFGHQDNQDDNQDPATNTVMSGDDQAPVTDMPSVVEPDNPALPPDDNQPGMATVVSDDPFNTADDTPTDTAPTTAPSMPSDPNDLLDIKQQALQQLTPLVDHLDQSPEEKFRTTMMMIQAADNQALVKTAYEAAQQITDEKVRAQALLDIVNEINYFTQHQDSQS